MSASGPGVLDDDGAWDYVETLLHEAGATDRAASVVRTLGIAAAAEWLDTDGASAASVAALIVAAARDPRNLGTERQRLLEHAAATADIDGFEMLVGPLGTLRTAALARTAERALATVRERSEAAELFG